MLTTVYQVYVQSTIKAMQASHLFNCQMFIFFIYSLRYRCCSQHFARTLLFLENKCILEATESASTLTKPYKYDTTPILFSKVPRNSFIGPQRAVNLNCNHFSPVKSSMANPNCLLMTFLASPYLAGWAGMDVSSQAAMRWSGCTFSEGNIRCPLLFVARTESPCLSPFEGAQRGYIIGY